MQPGQGSGRNGDHYLFRPAGVPADASMFVDFVRQRAWRGMAEPLAFADAFSCERASAGYAETAAGDWQEFGSDQARMTGLGLLIEPAATDISLHPVEGSSWIAIQATAVDDTGGPYLGIFSDPQLVTTISTNANARARTSNQAGSVVSGQTYALTYWVKSTTLTRVRLFASGGAGTSLIDIDLGNYSMLSQGAARGPMTVVSGRAIGDVHEIKILWTPNFTDAADPMGVGPGTGVTGDSVIVVGFRMEMGLEHTSPSGPGGGSPVTRAADAVTLALDGTYDLTFTFDDDSTQTVAGQSSADAIPTGLNRRVIKSVKAVAA